MGGRAGLERERESERERARERVLDGGECERGCGLWEEGAALSGQIPIFVVVFCSSLKSNGEGENRMMMMMMT